MPATDIVIDGLNVAYWAGHPPSLRLPLALTCAAVQAGHRPLLVFDASTPYRLPASERETYAALLTASDIALQVPSGTSADRVILQAAKARAGVVISRDQFRAHRRWFRGIVGQRHRRVAGAIAEDALHVPALDLTAPLSQSAAAAWEALRDAVCDIVLVGVNPPVHAPHSADGPPRR